MGAYRTLAEANRGKGCPECNGRGYFFSDNGPAPREEDCDECGGTGEDEGILDLADRMNTHVNRMIEIEMDAYPSCWTEGERRDAAVKRLGFSAPEFEGDR